jgi:hypothetical protein
MDQNRLHRGGVQERGDPEFDRRGVVDDPKRATTVPCRSTRNLVKFQRIARRPSQPWPL